MLVQITGCHTGDLASSAFCMYSAHPSSMLLTEKNYSCTFIMAERALYVLLCERK